MSALAAGSGGSKSGGSGFGGLLFFPLLIVAGYLLFIRPQRNRQKKALQQRQAIAPGLEVVTTAGLIATVVEMDDETVTLEIAPGVRSRFLRQAIVRVVEEPVPDDAPAMPEQLPGDDAPPAGSAST
jgi:preprotein translocase subunit YajC